MKTGGCDVNSGGNSLNILRSEANYLTVDTKLKSSVGSDILSVGVNKKTPFAVV